MKTYMTTDIQALEQRCMMAVTPLGANVIAFGDGQQLRITGTAGNDRITLSFNGATYNVKTASGFSKSFSGNYNSVRINGGRGNDSIDICRSVTVPTYLYGEDGNDTLSGGSGNDNLYGGVGNDRLLGNAGRDTLVTLGGGTVDIVSGGADQDFFWVDSNATEKVLDADATETSTRAVNRVAGFETSRFTTGVKTQAVGKELNGVRLRDPDVSNKAYVYKRFDNKPLFASGGPSANDVKQGQIGDCFFLATVAGAADVSPDSIQTMMADLGDGTYAVRFTNNAGVAKFYRVDNDLAVSSKTSTSLAYAKFGNEQSAWVAVAEKAFAYARRSQGSYNSLNGGWMSEVFNAIGAKNQASKWREDAGGASGFMDWVEQQLADGNIVTMGVLNYSGDLNLVSGHAYTVDHAETLEDGTRQLVVRNPWGVDGMRTDDGAQDGYVTLSMEQAFAGVNAFVSARAA